MNEGSARKLPEGEAQEKSNEHPQCLASAPRAPSRFVFFLAGRCPRPRAPANAETGGAHAGFPARMARAPTASSAAVPSAQSASKSSSVAAVSVWAISPLAPHPFGRFAATRALRVVAVRAPGE